MGYELAGRLGQDEFDPGFVNPADIIEARSQTADKVDGMADAVPISFEVGLGELGIMNLVLCYVLRYHLVWQTFIYLIVILSSFKRWF